MAIKDIIGPGFVGTATIEYIVTRGLIASAAAPDPDADNFYAAKGISGSSFAARGVTGMSLAAKGITNMSLPAKGDQ